MTTRGVINSNFYQIVNVDSNGAPTEVKPEYLPNTGNANNANYANFAGNAFSVNVSNVVGIGNIATINLSGNGQQTLLGNGSWGTAGSISSNYANYAGNVVNASQPNITSLGTLTTLSVTGNITSGNINFGNVANGNYFIGNGSLLTSITGANVTGIVASATHATISDSANSVNGANVSGSVAQSNYANIANSISGANVSGSVSQSNYANIANSVSGANVTGYVANADHSNISDIANSVAGANVTGSVNQSNYANIANLVAGSNVTGYVANATHATISDSANSVSGANVSGSVSQSNYANIANSVSGSNVSGSVSQSNYANIANSVSGSNVVGQVSNALVAGTVYTGAQPNITSVGTLTGLNSSANIYAPYFIGNVIGSISGEIVVPGLQWNVLYNNLGNANASSNFAFNDSTQVLSVNGNITANYFSGNATNVTGLSFTGTNFTDVLVTSPTNQQVLQYNGTNWVNNTLTIPTSAGAGVSFWFTSPVIAPVSSNNIIQLDTLNDIPNTSGIQYSSQNINNTTQVITGTVTLPLGRTQFDAGNWDFSIWANANSTGGTSTIQPATYVVNPGNGNTITITGTGTTRTATASGGTPFVNSVGSANVLLASYLQTSTGLYQITNKTSNTVVTISTPSTYVNQSAVSYFVFDLFYSLPSKTISNTLTEYLFSTTSSSKAINTTSRLGVLVIGSTTQNKILYVSYNDTIQSTHVNTPFITLHDSLAGLQGGQSTEYYHLTQAEYTGTGTGDFVRLNSPTLVTPNVGVASGTSLNLTGNLTSGNVIGGNLVSATYISGNGSLLTDITGSNVTGSVSQSNYANIANSVAGANVSGQVANALVAGTVYTGAQPNITSVGTLSSLSVTGNITTGNIGGANLITSNYFSGNGSLLSSITGANVTGQVANSLIAGTVYTGAQPNITSVGTLTGLSISGTVTGDLIPTNTITQNLGNSTNRWKDLYLSGTSINLGTQTITSTVSGVSLSGVISGDGGNLTNLNGSNVVGQVSNSLISGTVYTGAQPNITSVGTLTSLSVTGNITTGNIGGANLITSNYFSGNGSLLSSITGANVTGVVANATYAVTSGSSGTATSATTAGTVTTAAQPNITSVGTLSSLSVSGNITTGNIGGANLITSNYFSGNGSLLSSITGANVTGTVSSATSATTATTAGTVTTAAQPNITSTGSLTGLTVSNATGVVNFTTTANVTLGSVSNLHISGGTSGYVLQTDGLGNLSWTVQTGGSGTPGGSTTQLQYNNGGSFGGIPTVTYSTGNLSLGDIANVKMTGGTSNYFARTDGLGNLSWQAITSNLTVATRVVAVNIAINNYQMNVAARTGNVVVNVN